MLKSRVTLFIKLTIKLFIPLAVLVPFRATANEAPVDLEILKEADILVPYMTPAQKIVYIKLEAELNSAKSNLRSGKYLVNTKPSSFDPDRDLKPIIDRGEKLVLESEATINVKRLQIAKHLINIREQKSLSEAANLTKYDYCLASFDLDSALANHSRSLLDTCWALGYETLFFHTAFIHDLTKTQQASELIRNRAYDKLTQADGSRFSVRTPMNFELNYEGISEGTEIFTYDNSELFEDEKKALLAVELIIPEDSSTGLLSMRAIDLCTQQIIAHELSKIVDLYEILNLQEQDYQDQLIDKFQFRDSSRTIEILAQLDTPYTFDLASDAPMEAVKEQLTHTLIKHSSLKIVASDFIKRNYYIATNENTSYTSPANATITIEAADKECTYEVSANANERSLYIGLMTLER